MRGWKEQSGGSCSKCTQRKHDVRLCIDLRALNRPVVNRFINLAMALFKRQIAMTWKARAAPDTHIWSKVLLKWSRAESEAMAETCGREWDTNIHTMKANVDTRTP